MGNQHSFVGTGKLHGIRKTTIPRDKGSWKIRKFRVTPHDLHDQKKTLRDIPRGAFIYSLKVISMCYHRR